MNCFARRDQTGDRRGRGSSKVALALLSEFDLFDSRNDRFAEIKMSIFLSTTTTSDGERVEERRSA